MAEAPKRPKKEDDLPRNSQARPIQAFPDIVKSHSPNPKSQVKQMTTLLIIILLAAMVAYVLSQLKSRSPRDGDSQQEY